MEETSSHSHLNDIATWYAPIEERDLACLSTRYPHLVIQQVALDMNHSNPSFFDELALGHAKGRRGEVIMAIRHEDGRIWMHTKVFYPAGIYRLPSGGIEAREMALDAARREVWEEAGLCAEPLQCVGILRYLLARGPHHALHLLPVPL